MQFMGYDEKKLTQIIDEWKRRKWDNEILAAKENKMLTKHIMTRSEAVELVKNYMMLSDFNASKTVDFYIAAGMLEIKEEDLPGLPIGFEFPLNKRDEWTNCVNEMFKQGFLIKNNS